MKNLLNTNEDVLDGTFCIGDITNEIRDDVYLEEGDVSDRYTFDAFGNLIDSTGTTENNYLYCGEEYNETTGLYYLRARYMNP